MLCFSEADISHVPQLRRLSRNVYIFDTCIHLFEGEHFMVESNGDDGLYDIFDYNGKNVFEVYYAGRCEYEDSLTKEVVFHTTPSCHVTARAVRFGSKWFQVKDKSLVVTHCTTTSVTCIPEFNALVNELVKPGNDVPTTPVRLVD